MSKTLVVSYYDEQTNIALLENGKLIEMHTDYEESKFSVGDLYVGKIKKLAPNLNAAFVTIGFEKDAFLHYQDLGPKLKSVQKYINGVQNQKINNSSLESFQLESELDKNGIITNVLESGQNILIQITKEPISTKGPRISSEISLAGRFLVLSPFNDKISISKSIKTLDEKNRLKSIIENIKPKGFGVILRTASEGKNVEDLRSDLDFLMQKWNTCYQNIKKNKSPMRVLVEMDKASAILRDTFNDDFKEIVCDDEELTEDLKKYLKIIAPQKESIVKHYDSHVPIFEYFNVEKQIKQSFGSHVSISGSSGGYLVIEHTEALHVIDVNSGNINSKKDNQEESAMQLNLKAASEIARQLRLRDMGGIIIVDFVDLKNAENKKLLYEHLREEMRQEKTKHKILPLSKFGLMQITRQRVRPEKKIQTKENNPNQNGIVDAPVVVVNKLEEALNQLVKKNKGSIYIHLHPFIVAYLQKGFFSTLWKWRLKYKKNIILIERHSFKYLEIRIYNKAKKEIQFFNA